ncbi:hypothetical protein RCL1_003090 [Eukaryota sp. TZLM3-RCL]
MNAINYRYLTRINSKVVSVGQFTELFLLSSRHNEFISNISFKYIKLLHLIDLESVNIDLKFSNFLDELSIEAVDHETTTFSLPDSLSTSRLSLSQVDPNICLNFLQSMHFLVKLNINLPFDEGEFLSHDYPKSFNFDFLRELRINWPLPIFHVNFPRLRELYISHNNFDLLWLHQKFPKLSELSLFKCELTNSQETAFHYSHALTNFEVKFSSLVGFDFSGFSKLNRVTIFAIDRATKIILPSSLHFLSIISPISLFLVNHESWKFVKSIKGSFFHDFKRFLNEELDDLHMNYSNLEVDMKSLKGIDFEMFKRNFVGV